MKHYKTQNNEIRAIEEGQENLVQKDWVEIALEEVNAINQAKQDEYKQTLEYKLNEAKQYLDDTDHKMYSDYERKEDETQEVMDYIKEQRSIARAFIRANKE